MSCVAQEPIYSRRAQQVEAGTSACPTCRQDHAYVRYMQCVPCCAQTATLQPLDTSTWHRNRHDQIVMSYKTNTSAGPVESCGLNPKRLHHHLQISLRLHDHAEPIGVSSPSHDPEDRREGSNGSEFPLTAIISPSPIVIIIPFAIIKVIRIVVLMIFRLVFRVEIAITEFRV